MQTILLHTSKWLDLANQTLSHFLARMGGLNELCILCARALMGLFFIYFGLEKLFYYSHTSVYMSSIGIPALLLPLIILLELAGGAALLLGWRIRLAAALLAGFTLMTALLFHSDFSEPVQVILCMKNLAIAGGLLLFIAIGAGQTSLDAHTMSPSKRNKGRKTRKPKRNTD